MLKSYCISNVKRLCYLIGCVRSRQIQPWGAAGCLWWWQSLCRAAGKQCPRPLLLPLLTQSFFPPSAWQPLPARPSVSHLTRKSVTRLITSERQTKQLNYSFLWVQLFKLWNMTNDFMNIINTVVNLLLLPFYLTSIKRMQLLLNQESIQREHGFLSMVHKDGTIKSK